MSAATIANAVLRFVRDAEPVIAAGGATATVTAVSAAWVGYKSGHLDLGLAFGAVSAAASLVLAVLARGQVTPSDPSGAPKHAKP
jgi:hypothetical protein